LLSEASIESLREQGGPFSDEQALEFSVERFADEAVALRRHDDDGKVDGLDVAPLADYRELLTRFVTAGDPGGGPAPARSTAT
jgi:predicted HD phosphohydrolase